MFKMYDLNMKEIPFPDGLMPLDIFVSSIGKNRTTEEIEGRNGVVDYGTNYTSRSVELSMWINSSDTTDYRLLRNELYALFDTGNAFYIEETRVPSRVLKVAVDESFIPERLTVRNASVDVTCRTLDSVFWESKYTTLELHDSGFAHSAEKYGLVDNIDDEKVKYRFTPDLVTTSMPSNMFENGSIFLSNGQNADSNTQLGRLKNHYSVNKGQKYWLELSDTSGTVGYIRIFHYDSNGNHISNEGTENVFGNGNTRYEFTALGSSIRLLIYANGDAQVNVGGIGSTTKISLSQYGTNANFNVYNAGNVTVDPESMFLKMYASLVVGDEFTITNHTTGEVFKLLKKLESRNISIDGMIVKNGTFNAFRDTNKRFISLAPGENRIEITGASFKEITFNFKFYYK